MSRISAVESSTPKRVVKDDLLIEHRMRGLHMHWQNVLTGGQTRIVPSDSMTTDQNIEGRGQLVAVWVEPAYPCFIGSHARWA